LSDRARVRRHYGPLSPPKAAASTSLYNMEHFLTFAYLLGGGLACTAAGPARRRRRGGAARGAASNAFASASQRTSLCGCRFVCGFRLCRFRTALLPGCDETGRAVGHRCRKGALLHYPLSNRRRYLYIYIYINSGVC